LKKYFRISGSESVAQLSLHEPVWNLSEIGFYRLLNHGTEFDISLPEIAQD
jgi:hypothetical protein